MSSTFSNFGGFTCDINSFFNVFSCSFEILVKVIDNITNLNYETITLHSKSKVEAGFEGSDGNYLGVSIYHQPYYFTSEI